MMLSRRSMLAGPLAAGVASALAAVTQDHLPTLKAPSPLKIQRLAWAGVRLELEGATLFIDAITPDAADGKPGPSLAAGPARNYALVTHHHGDHCDPAALAPVLGDKGYLVCYDEVARYFDTRPVHMQLTRMYEPVFLSRGHAEFVVFALPAVDGLGSPQVSWAVDAGGKRLIHCGDTLWHGYWWDIARAYGPFDVAFMPINGFRNPQGRYTDEGLPMGLTPTQACAASHILRARTVVPIHYGSTGDPSYVESPNALNEFIALARSQGIGTKLLAPGDEFTLG